MAAVMRSIITSDATERGGQGEATRHGNRGAERGVVARVEVVGIEEARLTIAYGEDHAAQCVRSIPVRLWLPASLSPPRVAAHHRMRLASCV